MAERNWNEALISQVENSPAGQKCGRDARKYAVDCWHIHVGDWPKPYPGWKDPYAKLDKTAKAKPKPKTTKAKAKK